jgi:hypothetical protein
MGTTLMLVSRCGGGFFKTDQKCEVVDGPSVGAFVGFRGHDHAGTRPTVGPPQTYRPCPLMNPARASRKKPVVYAMSWGWPMRRTGTEPTMCLMRSGSLALLNSSVAIGPGPIAFRCYRMDTHADDPQGPADRTARWIRSSRAHRFATARLAGRRSWTTTAQAL